MSRTMPHLMLLACLAFPASIRAEPELLPLPREIESPVRFERLEGGYRVILTRKAAEQLRDALPTAAKGAAYADLLKLATKDLNDPDAAKQLDMLAFVLKSRAPALRKSLDDKMGPNGVTIRVFSMPNKLIPEPPPIATAIAEAFLPDDLKEKAKTAQAVIGSLPVLWRVEGR